MAIRVERSISDEGDGRENRIAASSAKCKGNKAGWSFYQGQDNPELREYWEHRRMMKVKDLTPSRQKVAKAQNGVCPICGDWLFNEEELHSHHKRSKSESGGNRYDNLILVHLYCHQQIHSD